VKRILMASSDTMAWSHDEQRHSNTRTHTYARKQKKKYTHPLLSTGNSDTRHLHAYMRTDSFYI